MPEKTFFPAVMHQKCSQSTKDSCAFFLIQQKNLPFSGAAQF